MEAFDDTFVANRNGSESGDQCFDSIHARTQPPEPIIEANRSRAGKIGSVSAAGTLGDSTVWRCPQHPNIAKPYTHGFNHHRPLSPSANLSPLFEALILSALRPSTINP